MGKRAGRNRRTNARRLRVCWLPRRERSKAKDALLKSAGWPVGWGRKRSLGEVQRAIATAERAPNVRAKRRSARGYRLFSDYKPQASMLSPFERMVAALIGRS
jgi:hypothetical protein